MLIGGPPLPGGCPIWDCRPVDVLQAEALKPFPIYRPEHERASDESIEQAWISRSFAQAAIEYRSGLLLYLRPSQFGGEATAVAGIPGSMEEIGGVPAFVVPMGNETGGSGSVTMVVDGIQVVLIGKGRFTTSELTDIAESVLLGRVLYTWLNPTLDQNFGAAGFNSQPS